jgi:hypothetical protein
MLARLVPGLGDAIEVLEAAKACNILGFGDWLARQ